MNCREFDQRIYLYEELTESERRRVDDHIHHCEVCSKQAKQIFISQALIRRASDYMPEPKHSQLLANRIMNAIEKEKSASLFTLFVDYLDSYFVRYAITAVSVFLISFFIYEQQTTDYRTSVISKSNSEITRGSVLDMGEFMNLYIKRRENRQVYSLSSRYTYYKSERAGKKI